MPEHRRLLTLFDIALVAFAAAVLWISNAIKWEWGTTPIPPSGLQLPILILVGCVTLAVGKWLTRIRR